MHNHVSEFKADIDILGLNNTLEEATIVSDTVK